MEKPSPRPPGPTEERRSATSFSPSSPSSMDRGPESRAEISRSILALMKEIHKDIKEAHREVKRGTKAAREGETSYPASPEATIGRPLENITRQSSLFLPEQPVDDKKPAEARASAAPQPDTTPATPPRSVEKNPRPSFLPAELPVEPAAVKKSSTPESEAKKEGASPEPQPATPPASVTDTPPPKPESFIQELKRWYAWAEAKAEPERKQEGVKEFQTSQTFRNLIKDIVGALAGTENFLRREESKGLLEPSDLFLIEARVSNLSDFLKRDVLGGNF